MGFGVESAACKSPASICVMGPSFFGRQAAAESHCLLTSGRLHLENHPQQQWMGLQIGRWRGFSTMHLLSSQAF